MTHEYHRGSAENLLGPDPSEAQRRQMSNELHVTRENPPVFLFHTADDPSVPVSNSLRYAQACLEKGVPVELHVYRSGRHGVGLALEEPALRSWSGLIAGLAKGLSLGTRNASAKGTEQAMIAPVPIKMPS